MKAIAALFIVLFSVGCTFSLGEPTSEKPAENQALFTAEATQDNEPGSNAATTPAPGESPTPQLELAPPVVFLPAREDEPLPASQASITSATIPDLKLLYLSYRNSYSPDAFIWPENDRLIAYPDINTIDLLTMWVQDGEKPNCSKFLTTMSGNGQLSTSSLHSTPETIGSFVVCDVERDQIVYQDQMMVWYNTDPTRKLYGFPGISMYALSSDGRWLATGGYAAGWDGSRLTVWDLQQKGIRFELLPAVVVGVAPLQAAFSLDGSLLAASTYYEIKPGNEAIMLWSMTDGILLHTIEGVNGTHLSFNPSGTLLAVSDHNNINLIEVASGAIPTSIPLTGFQEYLGPNTVFSPDGSLLVSHPDCVHSDQSINFWDVESGALLNSVKGCGDKIAFSPDGKYLIANNKLVEGEASTTGIAVYGIWNEPMISSMETNPMEADCNHPYLPLITGAEWTYELNYQAPLKDPIRRTFSNSVQDRFVSSLDGINVWEVTQQDHPNQFQCGTSYDVWEPIAAGFHRLPAVDQIRPGYRWMESRIYEDENGQPAAITFVNTITNTREEISTPAGSFTTTVIQQQSETHPNTTRTIWLAENVGVVRAVYTAESPEGLTQGIWELLSYAMP